ncbi:alkaline phosphatase family protein [Thalassotalea piscium]
MNEQLPAIIAGPVLRHVDCHQLTFWFVTSKPYLFEFSLSLAPKKLSIFNALLTDEQVQQIPIGQHAFVNLITIRSEEAFPSAQTLYYDFTLIHQGQRESLTSLIPSLCYQDEVLPSFIISTDISSLMHGSCRKPHSECQDGLVQVDTYIEERLSTPDKRPAMLLLTGDQIYADDVAGPMLVAIHQVITLLGLFDESWQGSLANNSQALFDSEYCYYQRELLLPFEDANKAVYEKFFAAAKKPIFTSVNAKNHLISLAEVFAMYLLVWSPELWGKINLRQNKIKAIHQSLYQKEQQTIEQFSQGLTQVRRALAHVPVYMIFDDHDITDDWNLTRGWEEAAYHHPFSKRIIGNALVGYYFCQGWGNAPDNFKGVASTLAEHFTPQGYQQHGELVDTLLAWQEWHYSLATFPKVIVLDTRTRRWRSESRAGKPSGLMDWEGLSELQQELIGESQVILVSAAPIYGVKLIETIQRVFTFIGKPLMVDAENWMAHQGTANVILNIFRHQNTPPNFIILSGDVHYSFVYEITHRFRRSSSKIYQITCSGIKNQFPTSLLTWFERLNRYLYATYSPLNWFTKRRRMKVQVRLPQVENESVNSQKTLFNESGIGVLHITTDMEVKAELITAKGETVLFKPIKTE